jgi:hypothetical protein
LTWNQGAQGVEEEVQFKADHRQVAPDRGSPWGTGTVRASTGNSGTSA